MATTVTIDVIKLKRGPLANIPTLSDGEPFYAMDTKELWIGAGGVNTPLSVDLTNYYTKPETDALVDAEEAARIAADNELLAMIQSNDITVYSSQESTIEDFIANDTNSLLVNNNDIVILSTGEGYIFNSDLGTNQDPAAYTPFSVTIDMSAYYTKVEVDGLIDTEETARIAADSILQSQITINTDEIIALDTAKAEITYVDTQDAALQSQITANTANIATNTSNISALQTNKADVTYVNTQDTAMSNRITTLEETTYIVDGGIV